MTSTIKKISKTVDKILDRSISNEERQKLQKELGELMQQSADEQNEDFVDAVIAPIKVILSNLDNLSDEDAKKLKALLQNKEFKQDLAEGVLEAQDNVYYEVLEKQINALLVDPDKISDYISKNLENLCFFFNCSKRPDNLESNWELNIEKDYRLVTGTDLTPSLKKAMTELFNKHRDKLKSAIQQAGFQQSDTDWSKVKELEPLDILNLVRTSISSLEGPERIKKYVELFCKVFQTLGNVDKAYEKLSFQFYRNLKSEMRGQGISGMLIHMQELEIDEPGLKEVWAKIKPKLLDEMQGDIYLD